MDVARRPWLVMATRSRGNRPSVSICWLKRSCRTRAEGRRWVAWLRARGWYAGVELDPRA
jgi:hypothetical protein